ncbi:MAG: phosphotransferase [Candidatus Rokubacteria bacterium]|nr:phosphotransferase [Candidatus Rokubacteria bacterium]
MIERLALQAYLARVLRRPVELLALRPLKSRLGEESDPKAFGYGVPLEVECLVGGEPQQFVLARTRPEEGFGHEYRADRAWAALWGHDAYNALPRHVRSWDVGFVRKSGELVSAADAVEFFQLVEKSEGTPYWLDLDRLLTEPARPVDLARTEALASYLAEIHAEKKRAPSLYQRKIRELVGHGEYLMGILDSYPHPYPLLPPEACTTLEHAAVEWRWRLRGFSHRLARVHGDFHPWNLLFREGTDFSVLDRSRGEWGEPAEDVAALSINYLFFGLLKGPGVAEPFWGLFLRFLEVYRAATGDGELFAVLPPFYAFRALVIAHPRWYPRIPERVRIALLNFAGSMGDLAPFDLEAVERSLGGVPGAAAARQG